VAAPIWAALSSYHVKSRLVALPDIKWLCDDFHFSDNGVYQDLRLDFTTLPHSEGLPISFFANSASSPVYSKQLLLNSGQTP
jgi:hypothetical protein